jgi:uncharacterized membrane protein YbhN (UPF0104 family)
MTMNMPASEPGAAQAPRRVVSAHSFVPKLAISLLLAGAFVWVLNRGGLPIIPARAAFASLVWWSLPGYAVLCSLGIFLRTYRWVYLLRPVAGDISARRVLGSGFVGFTAVFFAPLRMGEIARPWLVARDGKVTFLQATGTVAAERIIDGLVLTLVLVVSLVLSTPLSPVPDHVGKLEVPVAALPAAAYGTCALFGAALIAMIAFNRWRRAMHRLMRSMVGLISARLADWVMLRIDKLSDGLEFLRSREASAFFRDTLVYWAVMLSATWALLRGCGISAGLAEAGVLLGVVGIGTLIPSGPGFFGTFQLATYAGLAMFFSEGLVLGPGAACT